MRPDGELDEQLLASHVVSFGGERRWTCVKLWSWSRGRKAKITSIQLLLLRMVGGLDRGIGNNACGGGEVPEVSTLVSRGKRSKGQHGRDMISQGAGCRGSPRVESLGGQCPEHL